MLQEIGVQIEKGPGRRNFSDSKPKISTVENSLSSCIEGAHTDKKQKATTLTVDNADAVFAECFDIDAFTKLLGENPHAVHDRDLLSGLMKASIVDSKVSTMSSLILTCHTCLSCRLSLSQVPRGDI